MHSDPQRTTLIIGGTGAIGRDIAARFLQRGDRVIATYRSAISKTSAHLDKVEWIPFDLRGDVDTFVEEVKSKARCLHHLVIVAGIDQSCSGLRDVSRDEWNDVLGCNLVTPALLAERACRFMTEGGSITFIGSASGTRGVDTYAVYAVAKGALSILAKQLAVEWGGANIRVNVVAPSLIESEFSASFHTDLVRKSQIVAQYPLGRVGRPQDVSQIVVSLSGDAGEWISGQTIIVDGGMSVAQGCVGHLFNPNQKL